MHGKKWDLSHCSFRIARSESTFVVGARQLLRTADSALLELGMCVPRLETIASVQTHSPVLEVFGQSKSLVDSKWWS